MSADVWQRFQRRFGVPEVREFYAASEFPGAIVNLDGTVGSVGHVPFARLRGYRLVRVDEPTGELVRDARGRAFECSVDEPGELVLRLRPRPGRPTGDYTGYVPPPSAALGATGFGAVIYGLSYVPVVRTICRITDRYLDSQADSVIRIPFIGLVRAREGVIGTWMIGTLIAINLSQVALNVRLSFFSRDMFNALQDKDAGAFWYQLFVIFTPLAIPAAVVAFFPLCGAHGAMNFLQGAQLVAVIVLFAVSGIAFLFSVSFILSRWLKGE